MKKLVSILALFFLVTCSQRDEPQESDTLPAITQTGANTAGVIVDGMVIIPKDGINTAYGGPGTIRGLDVTLGSNFVESNGKSNFSLKIRNVPNKESFNFSMDFGVLDRTGDYFTEDAPSWPKMEVQKKVNGVSTINYQSRKNSCKLTITKLDFTTGIISGVFSGEIFDENNNKIEFKEGRFDLRIK